MPNSKHRPYANISMEKYIMTFNKDNSKLNIDYSDPVLIPNNSNCSDSNDFFISLDNQV